MHEGLKPQCYSRKMLRNILLILQCWRKKKEIIPAFINSVSDERKEVECAQVDGIYDEGPSHLEVQYWWTLRHFETQSGMVLVTSRNSGATIVIKTE